MFWVVTHESGKIGQLRKLRDSGEKGLRFCPHCKASTENNRTTKIRRLQHVGDGEKLDASGKRLIINYGQMNTAMVGKTLLFKPTHVEACSLNSVRLVTRGLSF